MDATTYLPTTSGDVKILYETIQSSSDIPTDAVTIPNPQDIDILSSLLDSEKENLSTQKYQIMNLNEERI